MVHSFTTQNVDDNTTITYSGETNIDNEPHGIGVIITDYGFRKTKFCGNFADGKKHGIGLLYEYNTDTDVVYYTLYNGKWSNDKIQSAEISKYSIHTHTLIEKVYSGFLNEYKKYYGKGILYHKNGNIKYQGIFIDGLKDGIGKQYYDNGNLEYSGGWMNNMFHGKGVLYQVDRERYIYSGEWRNGMYHGKGKLYSDTTLDLIYEGHFVDGKYDGYGEHRFSDNALYTFYEGNFKNGMKNAEGKILYKHKNKDFKYCYEIRYDGEWKDDKKHGKGTYKSTKDIPLSSRAHKENIFEGEFSEDMMTKGKFSEYLGNIYEGEFVDNKYHGTGQMIYKKSGKIYEGEWKEGLKDGKGIMYNNDGTYIEAIWSKDVTVSKNKKRVRDGATLKQINKKKQKIEDIEKKDECIIPDEFKCPISLSIMKEPVICSDGHTYDKESITKLFEMRSIAFSPKTRVKLDKNILLPNHNIRKMIDEFLKN